MYTIRNALTIDVEEHFQVHAFEVVIDRSAWDRCRSRVVANMRRILRLLSEHSVQATFFVLGWVADRHPDLVKAIAAYVRGALALSLPLLCQYQQDGKPQVHY